MAVSLGELAVRFGCELRGDPDTLVEHVATLADADERALAFLANPRYRPQLADTRAAAVVLSTASAAECRTAMLLCDNPYATYARIAARAASRAGAHRRGASERAWWPRARASTRPRAVGACAAHRATT